MFGAPLQISTGFFASWQHYCTASSSGRQPNFAALNRGRHLCSAGRPSGWVLAHILVFDCYLWLLQGDLPEDAHRGFALDHADSFCPTVLATGPGLRLAGIGPRHCTTVRRPSVSHLSELSTSMHYAKLTF